MTLALKKTDVAAIALALVVMFGGKLNLNLPQFAWTDSTPAVTIPAPSAELQAIVSPVAALVTGDKAEADRVSLSEFYLALADVIERDGKASVKLVASTGALREISKRAGLLMFQSTGIDNRYAALAGAIDQSIGQWTAIIESGQWLNVPLDDAKRAKAVELYRGLAWAFSQTPNAKGG